MEEFNWIKFDTHPIEFIKYSLENGNTLSELFLKILDEKCIKNVFGLLPLSISKKKMLELKWGGIWQLSKREDYFKDFVYNIKSQDFTIIFQNVLKEKSYPYVQNYDLPYATYGKEVYFIYQSKNDDPALLDKYLIEADDYPFVAFVMKNKEIISKELSFNELEETLPYIKYLIIGAYDEESYIRVEIE